MSDTPTNPPVPAQSPEEKGEGGGVSSSPITATSGGGRPSVTDVQGLRKAVEDLPVQIAKDILPALERLPDKDPESSTNRSSEDAPLPTGNQYLDEGPCDEGVTHGAGSEAVTREDPTPPREGTPQDPSSQELPIPPPFLQGEGRVKGKMKPRLVIVENVYHQTPGQGPQSFVSRYTRWLDSDEQTYTRKTKAGPEWKALELGWVESCCQLTVTNLHPCPTEMVLTEEQTGDVESHLLFVGILREETATHPQRKTMWSKASHMTVLEFAKIYPGESCRFEPVAGVKYVIRALSDGTPFVLNAIPN